MSEFIAESIKTDCSSLQPSRPSSSAYKTKAIAIVLYTADEGEQSVLQSASLILLYGGIRQFPTIIPFSCECDEQCLWPNVQCPIGLNFLPCSADPPRFSPVTATATPREGEQLAISYSLNANPPLTSDSITLTRSGAPITDPRVTVTTTSLTFASVTREDSGEYQVTASNVAGSGTFTLTVDVYCECTDIASMYTSLVYHTHTVHASLLCKHVSLCTVQTHQSSLSQVRT